MSRSIPPLVVGLALGFLLGGAVGLSIPKGPTPPTRPVGGPADRNATPAIGAGSGPADARTDPEVRRILARLDERMAGLEASLSVGRTAQSTPNAPGSSSPSADAPWDELVASVRALEDLLQERIEGATARHAAQLQSVRDAKPEADWVALQDLLDAWAVSEAAAREHVLLLSDVSVLERFGPPGLIFPVQTGDRWVYGQNYDAVKDAYALQIVFQIEEQVVTGLWVEGL